MTDNIYRRRDNTPQDTENVYEVSEDEYQDAPGRDSQPDSPMENHAEAHVLGKEVRAAERPQVRVVYRDRPAAPRPLGPPSFQERPLPPHMMGARIPELTHARKMMAKQPGAMSLFPKASSGGSPFPKAAMSFNVPPPVPARGARLDPFKGLSGFNQKKKLPAGMAMFPQSKGKKRKFF